MLYGLALGFGSGLGLGSKVRCQLTRVMRSRVRSQRLWVKFQCSAVKGSGLGFGSRFELVVLMVKVKGKGSKVSVSGQVQVLGSRPLVRITG